VSVIGSGVTNRDHVGGHKISGIGRACPYVVSGDPKPKEPVAPWALLS
jgi:hypothetical protein